MLQDMNVYNIISIPEARSNINDEPNIIPVSFKRKLIYKHSYLEAYINVSRIFKAIKSMKQLRNPFYTDVQAIENKQIYSRWIENLKKNYNNFIL